MKKIMIGILCICLVAEIVFMTNYMVVDERFQKGYEQKYKKEVDDYYKEIMQNDKVDVDDVETKKQLVHDIEDINNEVKLYEADQIEVLLQNSNIVDDEELKKMKMEICNQCYYENIAILLQLKGEVLESIGYNIETEFTTQSNLQAYKESLGDEVTDEIIGRLCDEIAGGDTSTILKGGVKGAIKGLQESEGSYDAFMLNVEEGLMTGFQSVLCDLPIKAAKEILGGAVVDNIQLGINIMNTLSDDTPQYLIAKLLGKYQEQSTQIYDFLTDEQITEEELNDFMYVYEQYWKTIEQINVYAQETVINTDGVQMLVYTTDMEIMYDVYMHNLQTIKILTEKEE